MQTETQQLICPDIFRGQRVLVVGMGDTGLSCVRFLHARGIELAVTDSRLTPPGLKTLQEEYPDVGVFVGGFDPQVIARADILLLSPGVSLKTPEIAAAMAQGKTVIGDIEVFARCVDKPIVAITGSNGKSTVTALVGEMARVARKQVYVGGNIGTPALQLVEHNDQAQLYVLELSSFQLETTNTLDAAASVILNISEDHMDRYTTIDEYAEAKARIYHGSGVVVINQDDAFVEILASKLGTQRKVLRFTLGVPKGDYTFGVIHKDGRDLLARGTQALLPVDEIRIKGQHNVANALAALALGTAVGLPMPAMLEALREFPGLPHRTQWVAEQDGVQWFNDSKATNVGAALAAISGLDARTLFVILGGQGKGQDFAPLQEALAKRHCHALLLGQDADRIAAALGDRIPQTRVKDMAEAVNTARQLAQAGDVVLLSPACASFDMFNGYAHRGQVFMQLVKEALQ
ncbi:MAG: UDP-N-acetylmuramoyl-L-alanine--D-glutamate ligase [Gammaproteobacteria bacterium]|nr:UDP-N-acetylmuramoyl-L-alanine--D-glutamate ligase [Gammaproteobacteria bacterium]